MIIFDTTVWIEHLRNNQNFFQKTTQLLENREVLAVECVFGELLQGVKNKYEEKIILNYWEHLPKIHYEGILLEAGIYSSENKLIGKGVGLIDTVILLTAIKSNFPLWTLDTKFLKIIPEVLIYQDTPA